MRTTPTHSAGPELAHHTAEELQQLMGDRLKGMRVQRRLRQRDLAGRANISLRALVRLETGRGSTLETLFKVLNALDYGINAVDAFTPRATVSPLEIARRRPAPSRVRLRAEDSANFIEP